MLLHDFTILADSLFPPQAAMTDDPIGLQITSQRGTASNIHVAFEVTNNVVSEAISIGADLLVVFHPLIFQPLKNLAGNLRVPYLVRRLIQADIALFVIHTNFDVHPQGTSHLFARNIGLAPNRFLTPSVVDGYGMGAVATVSEPLPFTELLQRIAQLSERPLAFCPPLNTTVDSVAVVGGSGVSFMDAAIAQKIDVLITADVKYHDFHAAAGRIGLIDAGHYEMEQFVPEGIKNIISPHLPDVTVSVSTVVTNPVHYHSPLSIDISTPLTGLV